MPCSAGHERTDGTGRPELDLASALHNRPGTDAGRSCRRWMANQYSAQACGYVMADALMCTCFYIAYSSQAAFVGRVDRNSASVADVVGHRHPMVRDPVFLSSFLTPFSSWWWDMTDACDPVKAHLAAIGPLERYEKARTMTCSGYGVGGVGGDMRRAREKWPSCHVAFARRFWVCRGVLLVHVGRGVWSRACVAIARPDGVMIW